MRNRCGRVRNIPHFDHRSNPVAVAAAAVVAAVAAAAGAVVAVVAEEADVAGSAETSPVVLHLVG